MKLRHLSYFLITLVFLTLLQSGVFSTNEYFAAPLCASSNSEQAAGRAASDGETAGRAGSVPVLRTSDPSDTVLQADVRSISRVSSAKEERIRRMRSSFRSSGIASAVLLLLAVCSLCGRNRAGHDADHLSLLKTILTYIYHQDRAGTAALVF